MNHSIKSCRLRPGIWSGATVTSVVSSILAILLLGGPLVRGAANSTQRVAVIHLHKTVESNITGLGVQWDPYAAYPPSHDNWNVIIHRVDFMQPSFLRVMGGIGMGKKRIQMNPELPLILNWAQTHKSSVILGTWWPEPLINPAKNITEWRVRSWARGVASQVRFLRNNRGFKCIRFYNFVNEPERVPISRWADLANNLHAAFERAGLAGKVRIIGPDTYGDPRANYPKSIAFNWNISAAARSGYNWPLLAQVAHEASRDVGMFDIHWYARNNEILNNIVERTLVREKQMVESLAPGAGHKPFVISESGLIQGRHNGDQQPRVKTFTYGVMMADYAAQVFRAGWNGISAWDLDDAMHMVNGKPIIHPPGKLTLKIWGFWNSQGAAMGDPADFNIRPWFYTWSLMSRMFRAGTRIVYSHATGGMQRFRMLAGTRIVHNHLIISVMLVNDAKTPQNVIVRIPADTNTAQFTEYRYFRHDRPVDAQGLPIASKILRHVNPARGVALTMPGSGVIFLTNQAPFGTH
jgi:hypothetical protein